MGGRSYVKKASNPKGGGRPRWEPSDEQRKMAHAMASIGLTHRELAIVFKKDRDTIERHFKVELSEALVVANVRVATNLFAMTKNNVRAAEFWLTNRDPSRWQNRQYLEGKFKHEITERPDLSGLSAEQLDVLRQAARIMRSTRAPVINGEARALPEPAAQQEEAENVD